MGRIRALKPFVKTFFILIAVFFVSMTLVYCIPESWIRGNVEKSLEVMEGEKRNGLSLSWKLLGQRPCGGTVDPEAARRLLRRATGAVERYAGKKPLQKAGSTDCNIPLSLGIPSICVGCYEGKGAHTREEYVETASLKKGYRVAFDMIFGGEG